MNLYVYEYEYEYGYGWQVGYHGTHLYDRHRARHVYYFAFSNGDICKRYMLLNGEVLEPGHEDRDLAMGLSELQGRTCRQRLGGGGEWRGMGGLCTRPV